MCGGCGVLDLWISGLFWFVGWGCCGCFLGIPDLCGVGVIYILLIDSWVALWALLFRLRGLLVFLDCGGLGFTCCFEFSG